MYHSTGDEIETYILENCTMHVLEHGEKGKVYNCAYSETAVGPGLNHNRSGVRAAC